MRLNNRFGCGKTMRVFWNRFCDDEDGASALEFALVFPLFATMLFGSLQMGLAYYTAGSVQYALERTARMTMVDQDMSAGQVQTAFENLLEPLTNEEININYAVDSSGDVPIAIFTAVQRGLPRGDPRTARARGGLAQQRCDEIFDRQALAVIGVDEARL
jgi:Flp pilus assembly protein TadG